MDETVIAVRMHSTAADAAALSDVLLRVPADVSARLADQIWLRALLIEQRRRVRVAERAAFDVRADRILGLLDWPEDPADLFADGLGAVS